MGYNKAGAGTGPGYSVIISHSGGYTTVCPPPVSGGQCGQTVRLTTHRLCGQHGRSSGNHCHFGDPPQWLRTLHHRACSPKDNQNRTSPSMLRIAISNRRQDSRGINLVPLFEAGVKRLRGLFYKQKENDYGNTHISAEKAIAKTIPMPGIRLWQSSSRIPSSRMSARSPVSVECWALPMRLPHQCDGRQHGNALHRHHSYELYKFTMWTTSSASVRLSSYTDKAKLFDVVLAAGAASEQYARSRAALKGTTPPSQTPERQAACFCRKVGIPDRGQHPFLRCRQPPMKARLLGKAAGWALR